MSIIPNPLLTNVLDMIKIDKQNPIISGTNMQNFSTMKTTNTEANSSVLNQNCPNNSSAPLENLLTSRNLSNQLMNNSGLPLGAQVFTIPASLATFPNSDQIPVFINSLGQMVLANTGNILANSLASLATTLSSIQQLSVNRDSNLSTGSLNAGLMEHVMQQYQQIQMLKTAMMQHQWPNGTSSSSNDHINFLNTSIQSTITNSISSGIDTSSKTISNPLFQLPSNGISNPVGSSEKIIQAPVSNVDFRNVNNNSPSASSTVSSRSVGNKINQLIDVSHDFILSQDDSIVKEKAVELLRQSYSQQSQVRTTNTNGGVNQISNVPSNPDKPEQNNPVITVDGVDLGEIKEFARNFKIRRLSMGLTQTQVGQALTAAEGPAYSQSAICRFEKLDITPKSAQKIKPVLEKWIRESEEKYCNGSNGVDDGTGSDINKKRKRRTSFTPQALEILNSYFEKKSHPTGSEMRALAGELNYDREVIRVWFCNKRQALKNSVKRIKHCQSNGSSSNQYVSPQAAPGGDCDLDLKDGEYSKIDSQIDVLNCVTNSPNISNLEMEPFMQSLHSENDYSMVKTEVSSIPISN